MRVPTWVGEVQEVQEVPLCMLFLALRHRPGEK